MGEEKGGEEGRGGFLSITIQSFFIHNNNVLQIIQILIPTDIPSNKYFIVMSDKLRV